MVERQIVRPYLGDMSSLRALWTQKILAGQISAPTSVKPQPAKRKKSLAVPIVSFRGVVLGVDPSVRGTGLAVIECQGNGFRYLASSTLSIPPKVHFLGCLGIIHREVVALLAQYPIGRVGVEETIFVQNFRTMQLLGCARGAALGPISAAGIEIIQMSPKTIKQSVTISGSADKALVQRMVASILNHEILPPDEADAAAAAIAASMGKNAAILCP